MVKLEICKKVTRIIGIDPGIADTGFSIIELDKKNNLSVLEFGTIKTYPSDDFEDRIMQLGNDLQEIINEYKPDFSGVEDIFFSKNTKTAMKVAQARGTIIFVLKKNLITIKSFTPPEIKKMIVGYGNCDKNQIRTILKMEYEIDIAQDDAADALAIAICTSNYFKKLL